MPYNASASERLQLWEALLERWLRHGASTYVKAQTREMCHWNSMSPDSCSIGTHIGLQRTEGAGKCWSLSSTEANPGSGQARRERHTPQEQFTSRAKFTLFEGKGEPCSTVQTWTLPIANCGRSAQLVGCCLPQQENNIFLELSHHIKIVSLLRFPSPGLFITCPCCSL